MRLVVSVFYTLMLGTLAACATAQTATPVETSAATEPASAREYVTIGNPAALKSDSATVLITGSNRGIGLEFVRQLTERGWNIIATARKPADAEELQSIAANYPQLVIEELDVTDFDRIDALAEKYSAVPIDILLSNAGIVPRYKSAFAKAEGVDWEMARLSYEVNAMAPLKLSQAFMANVEASGQKKIVVISSKAGSFELGPKMPMMYSYRSSKAALNMFMYTLSFETKRNDVILTMLSPGQVNTTPGFSMKGNIEPDESVGKMLRVIDGLSADNNGQFLDYEDGRLLEW